MSIMQSDLLLAAQRERWNYDATSGVLSAPLCPKINPPRTPSISSKLICDCTRLNLNWSSFFALYISLCCRQRISAGALITLSQSQMDMYFLARSIRVLVVCLRVLYILAGQTTVHYFQLQMRVETNVASVDATTSNSVGFFEYLLSLVINWTRLKGTG